MHPCLTIVGGKKNYGVTGGDYQNHPQNFLQGGWKWHLTLPNCLTIVRSCHYAGGRQYTPIGALIGSCVTSLHPQQVGLAAVGDIKANTHPRFRRPQRVSNPRSHFGGNALEWSSVKDFKLSVFKTRWSNSSCRRLFQVKRPGDQVINHVV